MVAACFCLFTIMAQNIGGSKYWRLKYRFTGKEKLFALDTYPEVTISEAREERARVCKLLAAGIDPSQHKKEVKRQKGIDLQNSFQAVARQWHDKNRAKWTVVHGNKILRRIEQNLFPDIGDRPIKGTILKKHSEGALLNNSNCVFGREPWFDTMSARHCGNAQRADPKGAKPAGAASARPGHHHALPTQTPIDLKRYYIILPCNKT